MREIHTCMYLLYEACIQRYYVVFCRKISQLSSTLSYAAGSLFSFIVIFVIAFVAFCQLAYLMFSAKLHDFSTFIRAAETMFSLMLSKYM